MTTSTKETTQSKKAVMKRQFVGVAASDSKNKTVVVAVERKLRHKLYGKLFTRTRKFHVHDEQNTFKKGDTVQFIECRPLSKLKRWRVLYSDNKSE